MRHLGRVSKVAIPPAAEELDLSPVDAANDMSSAIKNWIWATSTAFAPGAASIAPIQGMRKGHAVDSVGGMFFFIAK